MWEPLLNLLILAAIVYLARWGTIFGLFYELVTTLLVGFATLVTLRYWFWVAQFLLDRGWMTSPAAEFGSYWILFLIGCLPLVALARFLNDESRPLYPKALDALGGAVFGLIGGVLLVCVIATSVTVIGPNLSPRYDRSTLWLPFDTWALTAYRQIEQRITPQPTTRLPDWDARDAAPAAVPWR
jgi:uncharacterized membrane protein required for colicin V production